MSCVDTQNGNPRFRVGGGEKIDRLFGGEDAAFTDTGVVSAVSGRSRNKAHNT